MRTLNLTLLILCLCYLQVISVQSIRHSKINIDKWLNMSIGDVKRQCSLNGDYSVLEKVAGEFFQLSNYLTPVELLGIEASEYNKYNTYNSELKIKLQELIRRIQNCLNRKNRLDAKDEVKLLGRILNAHALKVGQLDPPTNDDWYCMIRVGTDKLEECDKSFSPVFKSETRTIYEWLMLQIGFHSTCEETLPLEKCIMNVISECSSNLKKMFKVLLSPPEMEICENFKEEILSNSIEDYDFRDADDNSVSFLHKIFTHDNEYKYLK